MIKKLIKYFTFFIFILILIIIYLSIFGIKTNKFNTKINSEILKINKKANIDLNTIKIRLNLKNLTFEIKTLEPKILFEDQKLPFQEVRTNVSIKSLINNQFSINNLSISTKEIKIKDIISISRSFKNSAELFMLDKIIKDGFFIGDIYLDFNENGKIKDNFEIKGFIKNGNIDLLKRYSLDNINFFFNIKNKRYYLEEVSTNLNQIKLYLPFINIKQNNKIYFVNGEILNREKDISIKKLNSLLGDNLNDFNIENINFSSKNNFSFNINKKLKINNVNLKSEIDLNNLKYKIEFTGLKKYFPSFEEFINLKEHKVFINYQKDKLKIEGIGKVSIGKKIDKLVYEWNKNKNDYTFNISAIIEKNILLFSALNYKKDEDLYSNLNVKGSYKKDKEIKFEIISLSDKDKNTFEIKKLKLNKKFKIIKFDKLNFNFVNSNKIKNEIMLIRNKNNYRIIGKSFDASKLIDDILNIDNEKVSSNIFSNLNSNFILNINVDKTYLDQNTYVNALNGNIVFKNNNINKLRLESVFPNKKKLTLTISKNTNNEKITTLFSNNPKPLINQYEFIKGFEEGVLDFYSVEKNNISNSVLKIDNFKVQEVPILAKLLTLASLQGIADLLTGEGIRFTNFEMKFSKNKKLLTIEELYAIGPAISILMEGYIDSKELISLRGTMVPATTINKTISTIPLIGNILVGKKVGEGVFGVSFKIKGPPNNLKTSVNPIKTLTPRFITRTLEKLNKN
tara:strand:+ start:230 stop:2443 length:2214 start_codon:yes stop_codon:yes gene_type:complete